MEYGCKRNKRYGSICARQIKETGERNRNQLSDLSTAFCTGRVEKEIPKVFIDDENTVAMLNMNQFKGHSGRAFHGIFVSASGAKTTVAAERDKFKISARRA